MTVVRTSLTSTQKTQIDLLNGLGYTRRKIAEVVLGRDTRNSTVTDYLLGKDDKQEDVEALLMAKGGPNTLLIDIETMFQIFGGFGRFNQNFSEAQVFENSKLLCACAKWLGSQHMIEISPEDFSEWHTPGTQEAMLWKAWNLLDRAEYVIAHNVSFDTKMLNAFFITNGLPKPSPYRIIDTLRIARQNFRFDSNKLDSLGKFLGVGRKVDHTGIALWMDCYKGDTDAWRHMIEYNVQDVLLLEDVYYKLRPWDKNHPNLSIHFDDEERCGVCLSKDLRDTGKLASTNTSRFPLYQCGGCGAWQRLRYSEKRSNKTLVGV